MPSFGSGPLAGTGEDRITSDWSTHVTGMTEAAPPPPEPPATPTGLMVSATTETSITWTWNAVDGADGYVVQANMDEMFDITDTVLFNGLPFTTETSYTATDLEPETTVYARVAAGIGTPTDHLLSAFTIHATGMTMAAAPEAPVAPANLRVKDTGSNYIEWEWDDVAGAAGYQSQFSTESDFSNPATELHRGVSNTERRVSNLEAEKDGNLRVRAYIGAVADPTFGEWSEGSKGTTEEPPPPPPAVALDAPDNVETSDRQDNSITVGWDPVDDAEEYEVQQREGGGGWVDANCGSATGSNVVTDTSCVASGLDEDTEYDFRVKAFPDSSDSTKTESGWSGTASATTTGVAPPPVVTTTSELNLEWKSGGTSITWDWDPVEDRALRERTEHLVQVIGQDGSCADIEYTETGWSDDDNDDSTDSNTFGWQNNGKNISLTRGSIQGKELSAGDVRGLCVVRTWTNELANDVKVRVYGTPELVWASTVPSSPVDADNADNPEVREDGTKRTTTFLEWTYDADAGFRYPGQLVSVPGDDDDLTCETSGEEVTSSTAAARSGTSRHRENSRLKTYRKYALCLQAVNEYGASELAQIGHGADAATGVRTTLPAAPSSVTYSPNDSWVAKHATGTDLVRRLVWTVPATEGTPEMASRFDSRVIISTKSSVSSSSVNDVCKSGREPLSDTVSYARLPTTGSSAITVADGGTSSGIEVKAEHNTDMDVISASGAMAADTYYFYACVRADPDENDAVDTDGTHGPWKISSAKSFARKAPVAPSVGTPSREATEDDPTTFGATVKWNAVTGADMYEVQTRTRSRTETSGTYAAFDDWGADGTATGWSDVSCVETAATATQCTISSTLTYTTTGDDTDTQYQTEVRVMSTAMDVGVADADLMSKWSSTKQISHTK